METRPHRLDPLTLTLMINYWLMDPRPVRREIARQIREKLDIPPNRVRVLDLSFVPPGNLVFSFFLRLLPPGRGWAAHLWWVLFPPTADEGAYCDEHILPAISRQIQAVNHRATPLELVRRPAGPCPHSAP